MKAKNKASNQFRNQMIQGTLGELTLKGSNVIAPGKEVRRNPGIERLSFVPALAREWYLEMKMNHQQGES
ncbi:hypothetical protein JYB64_08945 [Algoriphagus aestuarii]|nr:hypothetical protein [Algoriphagus aestuarii]